MKMLKKITKRLIIYIVLTMIILSSIIPANVYAARGYDSACGEYVSQYARDYVSQYVKTDSSGIYNNIYDDGKVPCEWSEGSDGSGVWHVCCTTGIQLMYKQALGVELTDYGWNPFCDTTMASIADSGSVLNQNFEVISNESELQAGDILCKNGHNEMYVGNDEHFNSGSGNRYQSSESVVKIFTETNSLTSAGGRFNYAIRLKNTVQVDPSRKSYRYCCFCCYWKTN